MKAIILLAVVVVARATVVPALAPLAVAESGASAQYRSEDNLGNYNFGYNEDHTSGGSFRREAGDAHGNVAGSYGLKDADGRIRIVNYIANDDGFKVDIKTNEPGVEPKDTADATFNKAETVVVQAAVAAPVVAFPPAEPIAYNTEQVAVAAPLFPPVSAPVAKSFVAPVAVRTEQVGFAAPVFPPVSAVPVAKTIAQPVALRTEHVAVAAPLFPPVSAPVAKTHTTTITETKPAVYAVPEPAVYAFPEPAAIPVAKTHTTVTETKPAVYAFPAPAAVPIAKSHTTVTETRPIPYAFPAPAAVPVAKSTTTFTAQTHPVAYSAPVAVAAHAPVAVAAHAPVVAAAAPVAYSFPAPAAVPVAKSAGIAYAAAPIAPVAYAAPTSKYSYSTEVINGPAHYAVKSYAPSAIAVAPRYALNSYVDSAPFYRPVYSPAVASFAGAIPYFNNIEYHGYPVVKK